MDTIKTIIPKIANAFNAPTSIEAFTNKAVNSITNIITPINGFILSSLVV